MAMANVNVYDIGDTPRLFIEYVDQDNGGVPVNPDDVTLLLRHVERARTYPAVGAPTLRNPAGGRFE
jgi:hypothetical protein